MAQLIDKSALLVEIEKAELKMDKIKDDSSYWIGRKHSYDDVKEFINSPEVKEVDLELITYWFDHIAQIADDRKTANGAVMEDWAALDEIKCLAKDSSEFIQRHYKAQKGEEV